MILTIETDNVSEVEQLLSVFQTMNLENVRIVMDKKTEPVSDLLKSLNRPIKKILDIDALKKAKNYKGINRPRFNMLIKEMNITEPIELLLSQLSL